MYSNKCYKEAIGSRRPRLTDTQVGGGTWAWLKGIHVAKFSTTLYLVGAAFCPVGQALARIRARFRAEFDNGPLSIRALADALQPARKTHAEIVARGVRVEADTRKQSNQNHECMTASVLGVDGYARAFDPHPAELWDSSRKFFDCLAHVFWNNVKNLFCLVMNAKPMTFTAKRQQLEAFFGRLGKMVERAQVLYIV